MASVYAIEEDEKSENGTVEEKDTSDTRGSFIVNPNSNFARQWDMLMVALLIFTALVTPFEVAFLTSAFDFLFVINRMVDFGFMCDMVLNFFLGYFDENEARMVWNQKRIASRYLKGWFSIDLVSILPFDTVALAMNSKELSQLKILRVIRLLRLIKLMRIFRSSRVIKRIQSNSGLSFSTWALIKFLVLVLICLHWTACVWGMWPSMGENENNWYLMADLELSGVGDKYLASIEFSLMAMVMGYGDFTPANSSERTVAVILMILGGSVYAYVIGAICGVVSERDPATSEYQANVDLLNDYMEEIKLPKSQRTKLREYFTHCKQIFRMKYFHDVLENMSPELQGEVAKHTHGSWLYEIPFFNADKEEERDRFLVSVALALVPKAFGPNEMVYREGDMAISMFIVQRGLAACNGRVLSSGHFFGEDMIAGSDEEPSRRAADVRSLTFLDVYEFEREQLGEILENGDFDATQSKIRRQVIRIALKRKFMEILRLVKITRGMKKRPPKEEYEQWKMDITAKRDVKRKNRPTSRQLVARPETPEEKAAIAQQQEATKKADMEEELQFWVKGQGQIRERGNTADAAENVFDEENAVKELDLRMTKLETQMSDLLATIKDGFETMEASQEVAFRAFYNAQKRQRQTNSPSKFGSPSPTKS
jgi:potassium voltage-gated channel Eag-related subfamily H protein 7